MMRAAVIALLLCQSAYAQDLPTVYEQMDELMVVEPADSTARIIFIRDGKIIATRLVVEEMLWTTDGGEKFRLCWQDWWQANRVVDAPKMSVWHVDTFEDEGQGGAWFAQNRRMVDLRQPD